MHEVHVNCNRCKGYMGKLVSPDGVEGAAIILIHTCKDGRQGVGGFKRSDLNLGFGDSDQGPEGHSPDRPTMPKRRKTGDIGICRHVEANKPVAICRDCKMILCLTCAEEKHNKKGHDCERIED